MILSEKLIDSIVVGTPFTVLVVRFDGAVKGSSRTESPFIFVNQSSEMMRRETCCARLSKTLDCFLSWKL